MCRTEWDSSESGKEMKSLKGMIYRQKVALDKSRVAYSPSNRAKGINTDNIEELLKESDEYLESDDVDEIL